MKAITIVGGGLAGLALGIGLRRKDVPAKIMEAGRYPRHRVCGEFISGNGLAVLERLELYGKLRDGGAISARTTAFFSEQKQTGLQALPEPALCLSRFQMDALLAEEFRRLGGELLENIRVTEKTLGEGLVRASGRRIQIAENGWRHFGLKVHARNVATEADLEMHFRPDGYVGICRLIDGEVNICGLLRSRNAVPGLSGNWTDVLQGAPGSILHQRLGGAVFDESSFCSVAGISLQRRSAVSANECVIGDALTMIPPLTGNGMSMAFESAEQAVDPLLAYSAGASDWGEVRLKIAARCDRLFQRRLFWADWTQRAIMRPFARKIVMSLFSHPCGVSGFLFSKTR